jgi:uncharacterized protein
MRYLSSHIVKDLQKKMVFLSGPRQCGKTTLAQGLLDKNGLYLNWDDPDQKKFIFKRQWSDHHNLVVLDELHKFPKWKTWLKGTFDTQKQMHQFLVTGSARLEVFKKGGDSLMGRYHLWHLHPFSLCEIPVNSKITPKEAFQRLLTCGGFPEPFLDNDIRQARRWRRERFEKVIKQDIRELELIQDLQTLGLLVDLLRARVGSTIVVSNIAEDLQKSPVTIKKWIDLLESMYVIFKVKPYTRNLSRSVLKPFKVYFYDNADVEGDEGAVFENLVATHLLKQIQYAQDYEGHTYELCFIKDKEGREVDFAVIKNKKAIELVEAKWSDDKVSSALLFFSNKIKPVAARQIVGTQSGAAKRGNVQVVGAIDALSQAKYYFD